MAEPPVLLGRLGAAEDEVKPEVNDHSEADAGHVRRGIPVLRWFQMLYGTFGTFLPLVMLAYGLQQGFAHKSELFACKYIWMDTLELDGVTIFRLMTAAHVPWNVKPLLGILSDALPLCGFHRTSYLVLSCVLMIGLYMWIALYTVTVWGLFLFVLGIQLATVLADLTIDATMASLARQHPKQASDLNSSCGVAEAAGGLASGMTKGLLVSKLTAKGALLTNVISPVVLLVPTLRRWLPEERLQVCCRPTLKKFDRNSSVTKAAVILSVVSVTLTLCNVLISNWRVRAIVALVGNLLVAITAYKALREISPYLAQTGTLLFLRATLTPGLGEVMFVWMAKDPAGPLFTPEFLGLADGFGHAGILLGVVLYNTILRRWKFRTIFLVGQLLVTLSRVLDLVLVMRWNCVLKIPDFLFFAGDSVFDESVGKAFYIPLLVLACKVCPPNLEGTVFSTLMALSSIGIDSGRYLGVALCEIWGLVDGNFEHLPHAAVSRIIIQLMAIPLILLLSPDLTPDDPIPGSEEATSQAAKAASEHRASSP